MLVEKVKCLGENTCPHLKVKVRAFTWENFKEIFLKEVFLENGVPKAQVRQQDRGKLCSQVEELSRYLLRCWNKVREHFNYMKICEWSTTRNTLSHRLSRNCQCSLLMNRCMIFDKDNKMSDMDLVGTQEDIQGDQEARNSQALKGPMIGGRLISFGDDLYILTQVSKYIKAQGLLYSLSCLIQLAMLKKCRDPSTFTIPCIIGSCTFDVMLDLDASINAMPSSVYKSLRLGALEPTSVVIQLANRSIAHSLGILQDMLVQINDVIFPIDFYVLDMKDELSSRSFLKTIKTKIDVHVGTLSMEFGDNRWIFYLDVIDQLDDDYINLHSKSPDFNIFTHCDCTCIGLNKCPICTKISIDINVGAGVVDIVSVDIEGVVEFVVVQPPLSSTV
ncbi:hypothetical protein CR513_60201, partial [Mucuna pruriens]